MNVVDALERVGRSKAMNYTGKREAGREREKENGRLGYRRGYGKLRLIDEVVSAVRGEFSI